MLQKGNKTRNQMRPGKVSPSNVEKEVGENEMESCRLPTYQVQLWQWGLFYPIHFVFPAQTSQVPCSFFSLSCRISFVTIHLVISLVLLMQLLLYLITHSPVLISFLSPQLDYRS
jgi:hypothetical protein